MTTEKATTLAEAVGHRFDSIFADEDESKPAEATLVDTVTIPGLQSPIIDLKSIVMSIEWEITDRLMDRLHAEVAQLAAVYRDQSIPTQFLKIMDALGRYIKQRQAEAHPNSIKLMSLAFNNFEDVVSNTGLPKAKQQALLQATVRDFKQLKQQIAAAQEIKTETIDQAMAKMEPEPQPLSDLVQPVEQEAQDTAAAPLAVGPEPTGEPAQEVQPETESAPVAAEQFVPPLATEPRAAVAADYGTMAPHEAFAVAVEEIKSLIKAEFSALRAEIRMWRQGQ